MGFVFYSVLWVMQDLYHQPYLFPSAQKIAAEPAQSQPTQTGGSRI